MTATTTEIGKTTRIRLMQVAEKLFAERGIDGVSIRDITNEADVSSASIHYHFGSKAELIAAILDWRAAEVGARRATWLDQIESNPDASLRQVLGAFVIPTAEMAADIEGGGQFHIGFLAAVLANPAHMPLMIAAFEPYTHRFEIALARVTPHLDPNVRELRLALAKDMVNRVIGQPDGPVHAWLEIRAPGADDELPERLIDFLTGAFSAPSDNKS